MADLELTIGTWQPDSKPAVKYVKPADVVTIAVTSAPPGTEISSIVWTQNGDPWVPDVIPGVEVRPDLPNGTYQLELKATDQFLGVYEATCDLSGKQLKCGVTLARATQAALKQAALLAIEAAVTAVDAAARGKDPRALALVLELQDVLARSHVQISNKDQ